MAKTILTCSVQGCTGRVAVDRALVPGLAVLTGQGHLPLAELAKEGGLEGRAHCFGCVRRIRRAVPGARFFSLAGTRAIIARRLAERRQRKDALAAAAETHRRARPARCVGCSRPMTVGTTEADPAGRGRVCGPCAKVRGAAKKEGTGSKKPVPSTPRPSVPDSGDWEAKEAVARASGNGFGQDGLPVVAIKTTGRDGRLLAGAAAKAAVRKGLRLLADDEAQRAREARAAKAARLAAARAAKAKKLAEARFCA